MENNEKLKNLIKLDGDLNKIVEDLSNIRDRLVDFRSNFNPHDTTIHAILSEYVIPYIDGLLGGGQLTVSLKNIQLKLEDMIEREEFHSKLLQRLENKRKGYEVEEIEIDINELIGDDDLEYYMNKFND